MTKFQYMVLIVAAIFLVLVFIIFGIFVKMSFSQKKIKKKRAPCPDYWEEVKNVSVVDVYPSKEYIYKNNTPFTTDNNAENIGNNDVQGIQIRIDKDTPFIRILNENPKTITACKVPASDGKNIGRIYDNGNINLRNYRYGTETNRKNYTTIDKIPQAGSASNVDITYDKKNDYYSIDPKKNSARVNVGDTIASNSIIKTPGFYWETECSSGNTCLNGTDNTNIQIWGNNSYTPSNFYIDFTDNDWHAINMDKSQLCNLKDWANRNNIAWDGVTNITC